MANESIKFLKSILDVTIRIEKRMEREEKKKDQGALEIKPLNNRPDSSVSIMEIIF